MYSSGVMLRAALGKVGLPLVVKPAMWSEWQWLRKVWVIWSGVMPMLARPGVSQPRLFFSGPPNPASNRANSVPTLMSRMFT